MTFDIHRNLFEGGDLDEAAAESYEEELLTCFAASPECLALGEDGPGWAGFMIQYGLGYSGSTPATMDASDFEEIVFEIFPRKVSCEPDQAGEIVQELRAFWSFVGREFALPNAQKCLAVLDDSAERDLEAALANPANFGLAKSFVMSGQAAGFDVTSQAGLTAWTKTFNQRLSAPRRVVRPASPEERARERNRKKRNRRRAHGKR